MMLTHCIYYPCYYHHRSQTSARYWITGNKFKVMTALNNTKWNDYINKWLLIKTRDGKWYFGKLSDYDSDKKTINLLALINRKFSYIKKDTNSITEAWVVDKWTRFRVGSTTPETFAYVANWHNRSVSIIDTATNKVIGDPVYLPNCNPDEIAITPDGNFAYVTCWSRNHVYVINTRTNQVVGDPIYIRTGPPALATTPDGKYVYVTTFHPDSIYSNNVYVIDTSTNRVVGDPIPVGSSPKGIAISPDGKYAYVTSTYPDSIYVIDTNTRKVVDKPITVGDEPQAIALTPDGKYAYVVHHSTYDPSFVSVVNIVTKNAIGDPIIVGDTPQWIAISPDGKYAYVANSLSNNVSVIDVQTNKVIGNPIPVGSSPIRIAITPDSNFAYVTTSQGVFVINTRTNEVAGDPIVVPGTAKGIAIVQHGKQPQDNWDKYIGYWMLLKYANNEWVFGKLIKYNPSTNQLRLLALVDDKFEYTNESTSNIVEIWRADKWTNLTTRNIEAPSPK